MSDDRRLSDVEDRTQELEIRQAELVVEIRHMTAAINKLTDGVDGLNTAMNKGKGALWVIVGASSVAGGVLATAISNFFGKVS